jgi:hypothetical protein
VTAALDVDRALDAGVDAGFEAGHRDGSAHAGGEVMIPRSPRAPYADATAAAAWSKGWRTGWREGFRAGRTERRS